MSGRIFRTFLFTLALAAGAASSVTADSTAEGKSVTYESIRPVLQAKCFRCHAAKPRKADLDLTSINGVLKGGESGKVVVAGNPKESALYEKVSTGAMPPGKKERLSQADVEMIRRWIAD